MFTQDIFHETESSIRHKTVRLQSALNHECFDPFFRAQESSSRLLFRPYSIDMAGEITEMIEEHTDIGVGNYSGFLYFKYSPEYLQEQKRLVDYLFHQIFRIPTIAQRHGITGSSFQEVLDKTIEADPYWSFEVKFDLVELLERISPSMNISSGYGGKQTAIVLSILSPVYAEINGKFISPKVGLELLLLSEAYNKDLYDSLVSRTPQVVTSNQFLSNPLLKVHPFGE